MGGLLEPIALPNHSRSDLPQHIELADESAKITDQAFTQPGAAH